MVDLVAGWFPVFLPLVTFILGIAVPVLLAWLQHSWTTERERERRAAERQALLADRRDTFQRQTLRDLQESVFQLVRTVGKMHLQYLSEFRKAGEWQKHFYDPELDEEFRLAFARTTMLAVCVRDDDVRTFAEVVKNLAAEARTSESPEDIEEDMNGLVVSLRGTE